MDLESSIESFFRDEVVRALRVEGLGAGTLVEHYLVQLLAAYAAQPISQTPLAIKMLGAAEAAPRERRVQLREIGDTSLYVSGFWGESLDEQPVDVDYYIEMGGSAYGELARGGPGWTQDPFVNVFGELAAKFPRFVDVLATVSRRTARSTNNQDLVQLYQRWQRTKNPSTEARLCALGVVLPRGNSDGRPQ